jgi:DNA-binding CsgD family transcriptional regulator
MAIRCRAQHGRFDYTHTPCGLYEPKLACTHPPEGLALPAGVALDCGQGENRPPYSHGDDKFRSLLLSGIDPLQVLAQLGVGLVVCGDSAQVLLANETAKKILRACDGLQVNAHGVLCTTHGGVRTLREIVRQVIRRASGTQQARGAMILAQRPAGKRGLAIVVRPLSHVAAIRRLPRVVALILLMDSALAVQTSELELYQLYGLTPTEARMANLLMDGKTLTACAREMRIGLPTARFHLKHVFAKTGVGRQSQLVSLLLRSIGLARLREPVPAARCIGSFPRVLRQGPSRSSNARQVPLDPANL